MATSESDDFESADEELNANKRQQQYWPSSNTVGSESDDDTEFVPRVPYKQSTFDRKYRKTKGDSNRQKLSKRIPRKVNEEEVTPPSNENEIDVCNTTENTSEIKIVTDLNENPSSNDDTVVRQPVSNSNKILTKKETSRQKTKEPQIVDNKKLGTRIEKKDEKCMKKDDRWTEMDMPEELKSDKKFKDVFKPQGWENVGDEVELPVELPNTEPTKMMKELHSTETEVDNTGGGWGSWGNWGISSLINTATAGVSTITSHVTHGLTLLEETMGVPDSIDSPPIESKNEGDSSSPDGKSETTDHAPSQSSQQLLIPFGFGNFMSGVSSITKLVETTGTKVVTGGLDTLEAIGKKTMEVLQEGDPGLKKKISFFTNEVEKPILSQILREAKERADAEEKTIEEKEFARKIHFESLFDDFQGLVHLEALEMLSKQCIMKIEQRLNNSMPDEVSSIKETLDDIKELCDLGDEEDDCNDEDLKKQIEEACKDIGVVVVYEKLYHVCDGTESYLKTVLENTDQEIFQFAVSTIAQFTALSVERFHKIAELILIKERRSTVNEADALVQLARILSNQVGLFATRCNSLLNERMKNSKNPDTINSNITTIFMEAANASSYIQDAFRLFIPILQVGAI